MNRVIKFRAWDGIRITNSGIMFNSTSGFLETPLGANMKLMQFTGLKDKNGIDIYECDILRVKSSSSTSLEIIHNGEKLTAYKSNYDIRTVVFYKGAFCLHNEITTERHEKESKYSGTTYSGTLQGMTYDNEIIGNIYQNADMLTSEK